MSATLRAADDPETEDGKGPESTCAFAGTRPGEDEPVQRGSTVVFLTTPPCPDFEGTDENGGGTASTGGLACSTTSPAIDSAVSRPVPSAGRLSTTRSARRERSTRIWAGLPS